MNNHPMRRNEFEIQVHIRVNGVGDRGEQKVGRREREGLSARYRVHARLSVYMAVYE
jgi:hypothetical protein